jgi:hypothetical protein
VKAVLALCIVALLLPLAEIAEGSRYYVDDLTLSNAIEKRSELAA